MEDSKKTAQAFLMAGGGVGGFILLANYLARPVGVSNTQQGMGWGEGNGMDIVILLFELAGWGVSALVGYGVGFISGSLLTGK